MSGASKSPIDVIPHMFNGRLYLGNKQAMEEGLYIPSNVCRSIVLLKYNSGNASKKQKNLKFHNIPDV